MQPEYRICVRCVMDTTDPKITFDQNGLCTHCRRYDLHMKKIHAANQFTPQALERVIDTIKSHQKDKKYDCVIGVSGGIDSSYIAYLAHKFQLRTLCVHLDNGWNSELAVKNIERMIRKLHFDLYTYVLDWEEFRDLQLSVFRASVVDIEMITDHAISSILYQIAHEKDIKYILRGVNYETEYVMPFSWNYYKHDVLNILHIHSLFGSIPIKKFPFMDQYRSWQYKELYGITTVSPLYYIPYNVKEAIATLEKEVQWKYYGQKHSESTFTKFYQGYILPKKFNIDKRRAHLSSLILSNQITREEALQELTKPIYTPAQIQEEKNYVIKKWGLTPQEFEEIMNAPVKDHTHYLAGFPPRK